MADRYKITMITKSRDVKVRSTHGAPSEQRQCRLAERYSAAFVIRYWPSKKGWQILDTRKMHCVGSFTAKNGAIIPKFVGHQRSPKIYPNEHAAVMHALIVQQNQSSLT